MSVALDLDVAAWGDSARYELIDGTLFLRSEPTPLLAKAIGQVAGVLAGTLRAGGAGLAVDVFRPVVLGPRSRLVPAISVRRDGDRELPDLVVEVRIESTTQLALGPKRLVYGRAGIPEYCFLDPQEARMRVLRPAPKGSDYAWPARVLRPGQVYRALVRPETPIPVEDLLPAYLLRHSPS